MNKEPETYEELIRYKRCVDLSNYYELSKDDLEKIYNFMAASATAMVVGNLTSLILKDNNVPIQTINTRKISSAIDGLKLTKDVLSIIPHYTPSSSGGYRGGSSSNNNNNNNNKNNNNR